MKKISLLFFLIIALKSFGQYPILNPSLETWRNYTGIAVACFGSKPTYWETSDSAYIDAASGLFTGHTAVQDLVNKCDGNFAIKLITMVAVSPIVPGVLTNGTFTGINLSSLKGGWPDTVPSKYFTGCYAYSPASGDTGFIAAYLFKWNSSGGHRRSEEQ